MYIIVIYMLKVKLSRFRQKWEGREAAAGSDDLGICIFAPMQLFVPLFRRAGPPLPPC
jgi:hypothetical protein